MSKKEEKDPLFDPSARKEIISLDQSQSAMIDMLSSYMDDEKLSEIVEDKKKIKKMLRKAKLLSGESPYDTIIMICQGKGCPMSEICVLLEAKVAPEGEPCPLEEFYFDKLKDEYINTIKEHLDIGDTENLDVLLNNMAVEIASSYLQLRRINAQISKEGMMRTSVVGISPQGGTVYDDKPHEGYLIIEKLKRGIETQLRNLLLTPEMREKYKRNRSREEMNVVEGVKSKIIEVVASLEDKNSRSIDQHLENKRVRKNIEYDNTQFSSDKLNFDGDK